MRSESENSHPIEDGHLTGKRVFVAMSGGVDSSVSAHIMKKSGAEVVGVFVSEWSDSKHCCISNDFEDVRRVCDKLEIDYFQFDLRKDFEEKVFNYLLSSLKTGTTPNPDIFCNSKIKFSILLDIVTKLKGDILATGHYCKLSRINNRTALLKGIDSNKDQSYFLHNVKKESFEKVLFPVGGFKKDVVRKIASELRLHNASKKDSTGICLIGKRRFTDFIESILGTNPGSVVDSNGTPIGTHRGLHFFTIGQRKGIGIGGLGEAWFVASKIQNTNTLVVVQGQNHKLLKCSSFVASNPNWIFPFEIEFPFRCNVKVRYRSKDVPCTVNLLSNNKLIINLHETQRAVTPGQFAVFYKEEICMGGAVIIETTIHKNNL